MTLCIGVEIAKSAYMFAVTMVMKLIGTIAHMYANMLRKGDVRQSKWQKGEEKRLIWDFATIAR